MMETRSHSRYFLRHRSGLHHHYTGKMHTYWSTLLDSMLYNIVEKLSEELACPHNNYEKLACLDG